jgi:SNF2 family DNA or RNA helicase
MIQYQQVVFCKLAPLQLQLYQFFLASKPVQQLLASTAPQPSAASGSGAGGRGAGSGRGRGRGRSSAGRGGASGQGEPKAPKPRGETLAPLAAITALKKLCCHPDLVYNLAAAAAGMPGRPGFGAPAQLQQRASARAAASGGGAAAASGGAASGRGGGGDQQLTGFEGCLPIFEQPDVCPHYQRGACQALHSGAGGARRKGGRAELGVGCPTRRCRTTRARQHCKLPGFTRRSLHLLSRAAMNMRYYNPPPPGKVMVLEALLKAIRKSEPTDKVVLVSNYTQVCSAVADGEAWFEHE